MASPVYILCSQSSAEDGGLLSLFNIIETIGIVATKEAVKEFRVFGFRAYAVWMRDEGEVGGPEYEYEWLIRPESGEAPSVVSGGTLVFEKAFARLRCDIHMKTFPGPGIMRVESRIRPTGTEEWRSQSYPVVLKMEPSEDEGEAAQNPD